MAGAGWREATGPNGQERVGQGGHAAAILMAKHEISRQLSLLAKLTGLYHPACRGAPRNAGSRCAARSDVAYSGQGCLVTATATI